MKYRRLTRFTEVVIHVLAWLCLFGFPLFFIEKNDQGTMLVNWHWMLRNAVLMSAFMLAFYTNYCVLVPRCLFANRRKWFWIFNIMLIAALGLALHLQHHAGFMPPPPAHVNYRIVHTLLPVDCLFLIRNCLLLMAVVAMSVAIKITLRWHDLVKARHEAEKSRVEAELANLRNQLNPHFLLHTLNNIDNLIAVDTDKAQAAVQDLSELLRYALYENSENLVPLTREMEFMQNYIELRRIGLSDNVQVKAEFTVSPQSTTKIAPLLFISLIENAFKHGVSPTEPSFMHICLADEGTQVICQIDNSYFPKTHADQSGASIGIDQLHKRLNLLYPNQYQWTTNIVQAPEGQTYSSRLVVNVQ